MTSGKAKLLCSFGGDFISQQGKLSYSGGKTRLVSIDRTLYFFDLLSKMADVFEVPADPNILTIKFHLPNTSFDGSFDTCLISVESDDDVANMIEEFPAGRKIPIFLFIEKHKESFQTYVRTPPIVRERNLKFVAAKPPVDGRNSQITPVGFNNQFSLSVGQEFPDSQSFCSALTNAAITTNFEFRVVKSDTHRTTVRCAVESCPWRIHASKLPSANTFKIRTLNSEHTCIRLDGSRHRQAKKEWVASCIRDRLCMNMDYKPRDIMRDIQQEYGVVISYKQAYLGRERALEEIRGKAVTEMVQYGDNHMEIGETKEAGFDVHGQPRKRRRPRRDEVEVHGQPRKRRRPRRDEVEVWTRCCTHYNQIGHNKRTCEAPDLMQEQVDSLE